MEEMSDKKTKIGTKIKMDGKYRVGRWCYCTDHSTKYSKQKKNTFCPIIRFDREVFISKRFNFSTIYQPNHTLHL